MRNLRILAGAEGPDDQPFRVTPGLQQSPGKYSDELLAGLDYLLAEMAKRDMKAVLYVNNTWEWSGGYAQYLDWTGHGDIPYPLDKGWPAFMTYAAQFHDCPECIEAYFNHIRFMLGRTNQRHRREVRRRPDDHGVADRQRAAGRGGRAHSGV